MRHKLPAGILLIVAPVLAAAPASAQPQVSARAEMIDAKSNPAGEAVLTQTPQGVLIRLELSGLPPGWHGVHIHESGICAPPFASAGGHFNPGGKKHGLVDQGTHAGDLPNVHVGADGEGKMEVVTGRIALAEPPDGAAGRGAEEPPRNILGGPGLALVVHAGPDDYSSDPAGSSGDRIACGVIRRR